MYSSQARGKGVDAWAGAGPGGGSPTSASAMMGAGGTGMGAAGMGFLSRAGRLDSPEARAGAAINTPVAYSGPEHYKAKPNFAPFGSTAKRDFSKSDSADEPQRAGHDISADVNGHFNANQSQPTTTLGKAATPAVSGFKSKSRRFVEDSGEFVPGPGTYVLKSYVSSGKPKAIPRAVGSDLKLLTELTRRSMPSIPSRNESYGYEKTPEGGLVLQKPLRTGFSGTDGDAVGPGDYDPPILASVVRKVPSALFSKGTGRNDSIVPGTASLKDLSQAPGPGYYNVQEASSLPVGAPYYDEGNYMLKLNESKRHPLSSFKQTSREDPTSPTNHNESCAPGPGTYNLPSTLRVVDRTTTPAAAQCFLSSAQRFSQPSKLSRALSPGEYNTLNSDFDRNKFTILKKKRMAARSGWSQNVSFDSTENRFAGTFAQSAAPPPGAYEGTYNTISQAINKWKQSKTGPFLTSAKRFQELPGMVTDGAPSEDAQMLSFENNEAQMHEERRGYSFRNMNKGTNSASFASKIDRFAVLSGRSKSPAPGTYDVRPSWDQAKGVLPIGSKPTEPRVQQKVDAPGPGEYDVGKETWDQRAKRRNRKNVMLCTSARIGGDRLRSSMESPGPGYYDPQFVDGSISKRTFNALMSPDVSHHNRKY